MTTPPPYDPNTGLPYGQGQQPGAPYGPNPGAPYGQSPYGPPGAYGPGQPAPFGQPQPGLMGMAGMASMARRRGVRRVITGSAFLVIGLLVTVFTLSHAESSSGGGTYIVAWGPMVFGIVTIIRGLLAMSRAGRTNW